MAAPGSAPAHGWSTCSTGWSGIERIPGGYLKFLIAGFGSIGRRHMRNLLAAGERDLVFFRSKRSTLPDEEIATYPVETDLEAALAHKPDAVIISNPTALHLDVAIPAAEKGCAILMEKPVSHSMERIADFRKAVQRGGGPVLVGFQFRYHPTLQTAASMIADGKIGAPLSVRAHWGEYLPDWHPWEDFRQGYAARPDLGGGVILTLCHPFDYLRWMLGEVDTLFAFTAQSHGLDLPVEETAEVSLRFASGTVGSVNLNYVQQPPAHTLEIVGSAGTLRWNNSDGVLWHYQPGQLEWQPYTQPDGFDRNWMFVDEMNDFLAAARGEREPQCTLEDGIRTLEIALLARQSGQDGQPKHCLEWRSTP
jgi:predicted dehydrogenase